MLRSVPSWYSKQMDERISQKQGNKQYSITGINKLSKLPNKKNVKKIKKEKSASILGK